MDRDEIYKTTCWARFIVESGTNQETSESEDSEVEFFEPNDVTKILHTKPRWICRRGEAKPYASNPDDVYDFTAWHSQDVTEPPHDRSELCRIIVQRLKPYSNELIKYRNRYNVSYELLISVYESGSDITFDLDTISFCNHVGIKISINTCLLGYAPESEM